MLKHTLFFFIEDGVKAFLKMIEISRKEKTENNKENLFGNEFGDSKISLTISGKIEFLLQK